MSITITTADANGASGTTTRTKKFAVKLYQGAMQLASVPTTPAAGKWSATWPKALAPGTYSATAGTQGKAFTVAAPPPPPPDRLYPTSPFWTPVGANPQLDPNSLAYVGNFLAQGMWANKPQGTELGPDDWTRPFYRAKDTDPIYTIRQGDTGGWVNPAVEGRTIRVPAGARPAGGDDSQKLDGGVVIQQPDGTVVSIWRSRDPVDGHCAQAAVISSTGDGIYHGDGDSGIGQAKLGPRQGQVTYDELVVAKEIPHALFFETHLWHGRRWPGWPGDAKDPERGGWTSNPAALPMGGRMFLAYTPAEIGALSIPAWKKILVTALAKFGLVSYDNGGSAHSLDWESGIPSILETGQNKWTEWAQSVGIPGHTDGGRMVYAVDIQSGIDWSRLRVLAPPTP
jgi:hypothetical protein